MRRRKSKQEWQTWQRFLLVSYEEHSQNEVTIINCGDSRAQRSNAVGEGYKPLRRPPGWTWHSAQCLVLARLAQEGKLDGIELEIIARLATGRRVGRLGEGAGAVQTARPAQLAPLFQRVHQQLRALAQSKTGGSLLDAPWDFPCAGMNGRSAIGLAVERWGATGQGIENPVGARTDENQRCGLISSCMAATSSHPLSRGLFGHGMSHSIHPGSLFCANTGLTNGLPLAHRVPELWGCCQPGGQARRPHLWRFRLSPSRLICLFARDDARKTSVFACGM